MSAVGGGGSRAASCAIAEGFVGGGTRGLNSSTATTTSPDTHLVIIRDYCKAFHLSHTHIDRHTEERDQRVEQLHSYHNITRHTWSASEIISDFWRLFCILFSASRVQQVSDLRLKFALRPHHVWKYGRHPICKAFHLSHTHIDRHTEERETD